MNIERKKQIYELKIQNKTIQQICNLLGIGKGTVGYYLKKIYEDSKFDLQKNQLNQCRNIPKEIKFKIKIAKTKKANEKILNENFNNLGFDRLRKRVILEQEGKCFKCQNSEWFGKQLSLEIDHKDGNNKNNSRENLEALCPNCHSITDTWRGRNKVSNRNKITDDIIIDALIKTNFNIRQSLIMVGLVAKGGNYKRCYRLINEINQYSN